MAHVVVKIELIKIVFIKSYETVSLKIVKWLESLLRIFNSVQKMARLTLKRLSVVDSTLKKMIKSVFKREIYIF